MNENSAPRASPSQRPQRLAGSQFHELLAGRQPANPPPQPASHSPAWPLGIHGHDILYGRHIMDQPPPQISIPYESSPPPSSPPRQQQPPQQPADSVLAHRLLSGRRAKPVGPDQPPAPVQSLNRDNSDRVSDLLHGREAGKDTSPGRAPLRSALLPPGYKSAKPKRVSWQY